MSGGAPWALRQVQVVVEAVGTAAFALFGVIESARKRLDAVGICMVGGLAASGLRVLAVAQDLRLPACRATRQP